MSVEPQIAPFWNRFPSFFAYPLRFEPLLACLGLALLLTIAQLGFPPFSYVLAGMYLVGVVRYGCKVLERTALGHLDDSRLLYYGGHGGQYLPYKQFAAVLVATVAVGLVALLFGRVLGVLAYVVVLVLWPANTMILAVSNRLGESLSPPRLWQVVSGIGMPYLGLCLCLLLLSGAGGQVAALLAPRLPPTLGALLAGFALAYFTVAMYRLMGYAMYQYHAVLGLEVERDFAKQDAAPAGRGDGQPVAAGVGKLLADGDEAAALALARGAAREAPQDPAAQEQLHRLLSALAAANGAPEALRAEWLAQAGDFINLLLQRGRLDPALAVYEAVAARAAEFRPAAAARLPLARAAVESRRFDCATRLLAGFDREHPGHADTAAIYLLGARLLLEHQRDEAQAERILKAVQARFPAASVQAEVERLLALAARLRQA